MKIGVIGCTHIPQAMPALPEKLKAVFKGVEYILHVGDVTELATLKYLEDNFTITLAVSGERDSAEVKKYVEPKRTVKFANRRIGMIHGDFTPGPSQTPTMTTRMKQMFSKPQQNINLADYLVSQFEDEDVDAIVFGHTHHPYARLHKGVFLFNPGAAAPIGGRQPCVGIMEINPRSISGKFLYI